MNLQEAKSFLTKLENDGLMYHLDDDAVDCLNQVTTQERAEQIQKTVNEIYSASLDWGEYECPIGYCIYLTKKPIIKWQVGWDDENIPAFGLEFFDSETEAQKYAESLDSDGETGIVLTEFDDDCPLSSWKLIDGNWE